MGHRRIVAVAFILACLCGGLVLGYWWHATAVAGAQEASVRTTGQRMQGIGVMSADEWVRAWHIYRRSHGAAISDSDLDWLLALAASRPHQLAQARIAGILQGVARRSPAQRSRVLRLGLAMVRSPDTLDRVYGCSLLASLREPSAVRQLVPLLDDTREPVREAAQRALHRLGWSTAAAKQPGTAPK